LDQAERKSLEKVKRMEKGIMGDCFAQNLAISGEVHHQKKGWVSKVSGKKSHCAHQEVRGGSWARI